MVALCLLSQILTETLLAEVKFFGPALTRRYGYLNNGRFVFVLQDVQHNCQLHRISFCADDKTDKRIFTFICKDSESNKHLCYVFDSEKCVRVLVFCFPFSHKRTHTHTHTTLLSGGGDHADHRAGLRLGLQEVPGVWRERRGDEEADRRAAETSTLKYPPPPSVGSLMFSLINAKLVSIDRINPSTCSINNRRENSSEATVCD